MDRRDLRELLKKYSPKKEPPPVGHSERQERYKRILRDLHSRLVAEGRPKEYVLTRSDIDKAKSAGVIVVGSNTLMAAFSSFTVYPPGEDVVILSNVLKEAGLPYEPKKVEQTGETEKE